MVFNFGETPFKFPPADGFQAICQASAASTAIGQSKPQGQESAFKPKNNAPQAVILEVSVVLVRLWIY